MRLLILLSGVFILANAIVFLLPTDAETTNLKYESSPEMNEDEIRFLASESTSFDSLSIEENVNIEPKLNLKDKSVLPLNSSVLELDDEGDADAYTAIRGQDDQSEQEGQGEIAEVAKPEVSVAQTTEVAVNLSSSTPTPTPPAPVKEVVQLPIVPKVMHCYRIGPFLREARMKASGKQLVDIDYKVIEREATEVFATRVFVGPFAKLASALKTRKELTSAGIDDHFHRRDPDGRYIVSLGIYSKAASAIRQRAKFQVLNINAETRNEKTRLPKNFWLELPGDLAQDDIASLSSISWGESSVSLGKHPCQGLSK